MQLHIVNRVIQIPVLAAGPAEASRALRDQFGYMVMGSYPVIDKRSLASSMMDEIVVVADLKAVKAIFPDCHPSMTVEEWAKRLLDYVPPSTKPEAGEINPLWG